ncbi:MULTISPECIES: RNA polymerase sigma factor [Pirellulaceae]|uniref:RNA polymerase sigma-70 factor (ECF subfamily) n=1 Tax=Aporhodopirellula rubra TaxID=980271 RepID=A0A7W5E487_9BACT|nr:MULTISPECIES: sigma-70 family RNA polymerase sigma factor [Pirellulaceae]EMI42114.1 RNA polymerase sigma-H factor [Rhodopirellula sp. SWK7]MBB3209042.1 RNA polymerase sigma-70 factor (ECF subfamily) [Aporhodopirellula rubra]
MNSHSQNLPTRISLLELAQSGKDHPAWEELLDYYRPFVRRILTHLGVSGSDLDDACQLALMRLWRDLVNYRHQPNRARFRSWLSRLIHNTAMDWHRHQRRNSKTMSTEVEQIQHSLMCESDLEEQIEKEWRQHIVNLALERLKSVFSGDALDVFVRSVEGESAAQISRDLNIREESVYVLKHRVKKRLILEAFELRRELEFPDSTP